MGREEINNSSGNNACYFALKIKEGDSYG